MRLRIASSEQRIRRATRLTESPWMKRTKGVRYIYGIDMSCCDSSTCRQGGGNLGILGTHPSFGVPETSMSKPLSRRSRDFFAGIPKSGSR